MTEQEEEKELQKTVRALDLFKTIILLDNLAQLMSQKGQRPRTARKSSTETPLECEIRNRFEIATGKRSLMAEILYRAHLENLMFMLHGNTDEALAAINIPVWTILSAVNPATHNDGKEVVQVCNAFANSQIDLPTE